MAPSDDGWEDVPSESAPVVKAAPAPIIAAPANNDGWEDVPASSTPAVSGGYPYNKQSDFEDLYANAKEVGYSGLDSAQKQLFDQAFPYSIYAQQGNSLDEAHAETDARATGPSTFEKVKAAVGNAANETGTVLRKAIAPEVATIGGVVGGLQGAITNDYQDRTKSIVEGAESSAKAVYDDAISGKGLAGAVADPTNALFFIPGVGEANALKGVKYIPEGAGKVLGFAGAKEIPSTLGTGLTQAAIGAGATAASEALNPSSKVDLGDMAQGAALGGSLGLVGSGIKNAAIKHYPNADVMTTTPNSGMTPVTNEDIYAQMQSTKFPYAYNQQLEAARNNRLKVGEDYSKAYGEIPERLPQLKNSGFKLEELPTDKPATAERRKEAFRQIAQASVDNPVNLSDFARAKALHQEMFNRPGLNPAPIEQYIGTEKDPIFKNMVELEHLKRIKGAIPYGPTKHEVDLQLKRKLSDLQTNLELQPKYGIKGLGRILYSDPALIKAQDFGKLRNKNTSQYGVGDPNAMAKKVADAIMHTAIVDRLSEMYPEYKDYLKSHNTNVRYAKAKTIEHYAEKGAPNPRGLSRALPAIGNNYVIPTIAAKIGALLKGKAGLVGAALGKNKPDNGR